MRRRAAGAAFLAMDLERLGHPDAAERFLNWYGEFSGEHHPFTLAHHYIAYRAQVRTKVACLRHEQGGPSAADEARLLHGLVLNHLRRGRVVLTLVGGLPGTGKSRLISGLADTYGWALLSSDALRKDMAGLGHTTDAHAEVGQGLYRPEQVARVYQELLLRAQHLLEQGVPVVLDASWASARDRTAAADVAQTTHSDLVQLRCETPLDVARARLAVRRPGSGTSDATPEVLDAMAERTDPWPEAPRCAPGTRSTACSPMHIGWWRPNSTVRCPPGSDWAVWPARHGPLGPALPSMGSYGEDEGSAEARHDTATYESARGVLVAIALALLLALPAGPPQAGHPDENGELDVELAIRHFAPDHLYLPTGQPLTLTFTNHGDVGHPARWPPSSSLLWSQGAPFFGLGWWRAAAVIAAVASFVQLGLSFHPSFTAGLAIDIAIVLAVAWAGWPPIDALGA